MWANNLISAHFFVNLPTLTFSIYPLPYGWYTPQCLFLHSWSFLHATILTRRVQSPPLSTKQIRTPQQCGSADPAGPPLYPVRACDIQQHLGAQKLHGLMTYWFEMLLCPQKMVSVTFYNIKYIYCIYS